MKKWIVFCCSSLWLCSCVVTQTAPLGETKPDDLPVYMSKLPEQSYSELVYIEASGSVFHSKKALLKKMKKQAKAEGADAIVSLKFGYIENWLTGVPMAEGVAIKYK